MQDEHEFETIQDALDKLIKDLTDALDNSTNSIAETFEHFAETLKSIIGDSGSADVNGSVGNIVNLIMHNFSDELQKVSASPTDLGGSSNSSGVKGSTVTVALPQSQYMAITEENFNALGDDVKRIYELNQKFSNAITPQLSAVNNNLMNSTNLLREIGSNTSMSRNMNHTVNLNYDSLLNVGSLDVSSLDKKTQQYVNDAFSAMTKQLKQLGYNIKY